MAAADRNETNAWNGAVSKCPWVICPLPLARSCPMASFAVDSDRFALAPTETTTMPEPALALAVRSA